MSDMELLAKVCALLARTESPFEEEARTAALMAARLIKKHSLIVTTADASRSMEETIFMVKELMSRERAKCGAIGGHARARSLSSTKRTKIAKKAAKARWHRPV